MSNIASLAEVPDISFIGNTTLEELQRHVLDIYAAKYKELTGQEPTLSDADPVTLVQKSMTAICYQVMQYIDTKGRMEMLKTSEGEALDNLAALFGIVRNQAEHANVKMRFNLSAAQKSVVMIPEGTRVRTGGGIYFSTVKYAEIPVGQLYTDVTARAEAAGTAANGLLEGAIDTLVDAIPYVASIENIAISSGGTDVENDDSLTERIFLAPTVYSCAGPKDAYEYWARSFRSDVSDVVVTSPSECVVAICFILNGGVLPTEADMKAMKEYMANDARRPMCDKVICYAPAEVEYDIDVKYWIAASDSKGAGIIQENINAAVEEYQTWQRTIGRDINPTELIFRLRQAGAKRVAVTSPVDVCILADQIAKIGNCAVTYGGLEDD